MPKGRVSEWDIGAVSTDPPLPGQATEKVTVMNLALKIQTSEGGDAAGKLRYLQDKLDFFIDPNFIPVGSEKLRAPDSSTVSTGSRPGTTSTQNGPPHELPVSILNSDQGVERHTQEDEAPADVFQQRQQRDRTQGRSPASGQETLEDRSSIRWSSAASTNTTHQPVAENDDTDSEVDGSFLFGPLDRRIRRAVQNQPLLGAPERIIRTLHALPGEMRSVLYQFPVDNESEGAKPRLFRCPFNVLDPRSYRRGDCKGPGFSLAELV